MRIGTAEWAAWERDLDACWHVLTGLSGEKTRRALRMLKELEAEKATPAGVGSAGVEEGT